MECFTPLMSNNRFVLARLLRRAFSDTFFKMESTRGIRTANTRIQAEIKKAWNVPWLITAEKLPVGFLLEMV